MVPLLFMGLLKFLKPVRGSWRLLGASWACDSRASDHLQAKTPHPLPKHPACSASFAGGGGWYGGGPRPWPGAVGSQGAPLAGGPVWACPRKFWPRPLPGGPWRGLACLGALAPGGPEPLARGPLARPCPGALGPGARPLKAARNPKPRNRATSLPRQPPGPGIQLPGTRGPLGGGGPEPKTLNRPPDAKGYDLGLYFSYAKGGLGAGHPLAEY